MECITTVPKVFAFFSLICFIHPHSFPQPQNKQTNIFSFILTGPKDPGIFSSMFISSTIFIGVWTIPPFITKMAFKTNKCTLFILRFFFLPTKEEILKCMQASLEELVKTTDSQNLLLENETTVGLIWDSEINIVCKYLRRIYRKLFLEVRNNEIRRLKKQQNKVTNAFNLSELCSQCSSSMFLAVF